MTNATDLLSVSELESRAEGHRTRLTQLADQLSDRLAPSTLIDEAIHSVRRNGGDELMSTATRAVSRNPLPMAIAGLSIGYAAHLVRKETGGYTPETRTRIDRNVAVHGDEAREETSSVSEMVDDLKERGLAAVDQARAEAKRIEARVKAGTYDPSDAVRDHPLLIGAIGLGLGVAAAALLPATRAEDRTLGRARDRAVERTRELVTDGLEDAKSYAAARVDAIKLRWDKAAPYTSQGKRYTTERSSI